MSVVVADMVLADNRTADSIAVGPPHLSPFGLVAFTVELAGSLGLRVQMDPVPEEPAHAVVIGKKTKAIKRRLAESSRWVIGPRSSWAPPKAP